MKREFISERLPKVIVMNPIWSHRQQSRNHVHHDTNNFRAWRCNHQMVFSRGGIALEQQDARLMPFSHEESHDVFSLWELNYDWHLWLEKLGFGKYRDQPLLREVRFHSVVAHLNANRVGGSSKHGFWMLCSHNLSHYTLHSMYGDLTRAFPGRS
jgi:hypothetical protein